MKTPSESRSRAQVPHEGGKLPGARASNRLPEIGQSAAELVYHNRGKDNRDCEHSNANYAWYIEPSGAMNYNNNNKNNSYCVRACAEPPATPVAVYGIPFTDILAAWDDCERKKRNTNSALRFRWDAPRQLAQLWREMDSGTYKPHASSVFLIHYPVHREVWAAAFRDRVAHHWEAARFDPVLQDFIRESGDRSYNCRKGFGQMKAVAAFRADLERATEGWTREDCYIVSGDFQNFFMAIDKDLLWRRLLEVVGERYEGADKPALLDLMRRTLFHRCQDLYIRRSDAEGWKDLPPRKSLFHMDGLPIGNLPSQLWANFLGAHFMRWMLETGRGSLGFVLFVDDFKVLVRNPIDARLLISEIRSWLADNLHVTLHPDKTSVQHARKGSRLTGAVAKPGRTYISNRTRGRFITKLHIFRNRLLPQAVRLDRLASAGDTRARYDLMLLLEHVRAVINSYLGIMSHHSSYRLRRRICMELILPDWSRWLAFPDGFRKCIIPHRADQRRALKRRLRSHRAAERMLRPRYQEE